MSRLDLFLKNSGLLKQRTQAKRACETNCVSVNGRFAKASHEVSAGEIIVVDTEELFLEAEVLDIPNRPCSKKLRDRFVRILQSEKRNPDEFLTF